MKREYRVVRHNSLYDLKAEVNLYLSGGSWKSAGGLAVYTTHNEKLWFCQAVTRQVNEHGIGVDDPLGTWHQKARLVQDE